MCSPGMQTYMGMCIGECYVMCTIYLIQWDVQQEGANHVVVLLGILNVPTSRHESGVVCPEEIQGSLLHSILS